MLTIALMSFAMITAVSHLAKRNRQRMARVSKPRRH